MTVNPRDYLPIGEDAAKLPAEILGSKLLQFLAADVDGAGGSHFLNEDSITNPNVWPAEMLGSNRQAFLRAVAEGWAWLVSKGLVARKPDSSSGGFHILTQRGRDLAAEREPLVRLKAHELLDVDLSQELTKARVQFALGEYELAAFAAMREVEIKIRLLGSYGDSDIGVKMAKSAFGPGGPLRDPTMDPGEQDATMALFWGAIGVIKNPSSHRQVDYNDPTLAAEVVLFADLLLRMLRAKIPGRLAGMMTGRP